MGWKGLIQAQVANAFKILDDLVASYVYRDKSAGVLVDGQYSYADSETSVQGTLTKFDSRRIDGTIILQGDMELIVQVSDLASISDEAEFDDPDGQTWTVINKDKDPSDTIWQIQLRRAGGTSTLGN